MTIAIKLSALALLAAGINGAVLTEASAGSVTPPFSITSMTPPGTKIQLLGSTNRASASAMGAASTGAASATGAAAAAAS